MNKNQIGGLFKRGKGKLKEEIGHATGNVKMESEGVIDQIRGKASKNIGKVKDAVKKGIDHTLSKI